MGVGPIETLGKYGADVGLKEMMHTTAIHFDKGFALNGFAWVTNCWELSLPYNFDNLTKWLRQIKSRWPNVRFITQGAFGLIWRRHYKQNTFNYRFVESGSGIGGSDKDKQIRWFMNKHFRLALLSDLHGNDQKVIDYTDYNKKASEPVSGSTRNWSLMGEINQKGIRAQDKPRPLETLTPKDKTAIKSEYPALFNKEQQ